MSLVLARQLVPLSGGSFQTDAPGIAAQFSLARFAISLAVRARE